MLYVHAGVQGDYCSMLQEIKLGVVVAHGYNGGGFPGNAVSKIPSVLGGGAL